MEDQTVLCTERLQFQNVRAKDDLEISDLEFCHSKIRYAPVDQPRLIVIKYKC